MTVYGEKSTPLTAPVCRTMHVPAEALFCLCERIIQIHPGVSQQPRVPISYDSLEHAWGRARSRTKLTDRLTHDLRRTAARDFRRAGVSEGEIMKLCGWKTRAMFDRYNVIDEAHLASAVGKRFSPANGTVTAQERASRQGAAA